MVLHSDLYGRCLDGVAVIAQRYVPGKDEQRAKGVALVGALGINWDALLADMALKILRNVGDLAIQYGKERRADIEAAANDAIGTVVAWNIPGLPETIEVKIDAAFETHAKAAVHSLLNGVFGPESSI